MCVAKYKNKLTGKWEELMNGIDGKDGTNGLTPFINTDGNWQIGDKDTGVKAAGVDGKDGVDGYTPVKGVDYFTDEEKDEFVGVTSWNDLTDKPFGEETTTVYEPFSLTWDGNTEGLTHFANRVFKISDLVLTDEQIKTAQVTLSTGSTTLLANSWSMMASTGDITEDYTSWGHTCVFVRKSGVKAHGFTYPEPGIYSENYRGYYVESLAISAPVEQTKTVVKKLDMKYLPDNVGGASVQSDLAQNDPTAPDYVKNRTHYEEIVAVHDPINITWDGNTDGLVHSSSLSGSPEYKVSDLVLTDEYIKTCVIGYSDGSTQLAKDASWLYGTDAVAIGAIRIIRNANAALDLPGGVCTYPEPGIYFTTSVVSLTSDGLIETTVHQLDEKYIPDIFAHKSDIPEQVQSDWNQCIETAPDYIKNKTHGEVIVVHDSVTEEATSSIPTHYGKLATQFCLHSNVAMPEGKYILITIGGETKKITTAPSRVGTSNLYKETITFDNGVNVISKLSNIAPGSSKADRKYFYYQAYPDITSPELELYIGTPFTVELVSDELKQLDEKFIPDTIARVADIPEVTEQVQSDWNQTDENKADYIKNKPQEVSEEEFLDWLNEAKVVEPVATASGEIYTTNNNEIYVL